MVFGGVLGRHLGGILGGIWLAFGGQKPTKNQICFFGLPKGWRRTVVWKLLNSLRKSFKSLSSNLSVLVWSSLINDFLMTFY